MEPDRFQQAWRAQSSQTRVTVDADLLTKEVERNRHEFRATILLRDIREVGVAAVLIPVWFYLGAKNAHPWTWYLCVPACIWVAGFILVDRLRHPPSSNLPGESLVRNVRTALAEVEHQIWLLRNVHWWYLLPFTVALMAFFAQVTWENSKSIGLEALASGVFASCFVLALYAFIYWLNQLAVRRQLEPRRQELLALLAGLTNEVSDEAEGWAAEEARGNPTDLTRRNRGRTLALAAFLGAITAFASVVAHFAGEAAAGYAKLSPFAAVRWVDEKPQVNVEGQWFDLVALNDIPASDMIAFSRANYGEKWRKRFEEDLVELMSRMGRPPGEAVDLEVRTLDSEETKTLEDVPMTAENRRAIREAARDTEKSEP